MLHESGERGYRSRNDLRKVCGDDRTAGAAAQKIYPVYKKIPGVAEDYLIRQIQTAVRTLQDNETSGLYPDGLHDVSCNLLSSVR